MPDATAPQSQPVLGLTGWPATLCNISAVAVLIWLVTVQMPRQEDRFFLEMDRQRQITADVAVKLSAAIDNNTTAVRDLSSETRSLRRDRQESKP